MAADGTGGGLPSDLGTSHSTGGPTRLMAADGMLLHRTYSGRLAEGSSMEDFKETSVTFCV